VRDVAKKFQVDW